MTENKPTEISLNPLAADSNFIGIIHSTVAAIDSSAALAQLLAQHKMWLSTKLQQRGALLFRGFNVKSQSEFSLLFHTLENKPMSYQGGDSPRTRLENNIYTSTEYPASQEISLHNELSYSSGYPQRLYLCCIQPADTGGETPLADSRKILHEIDPQVRALFKAKGVKYTQFLHGEWGLGKSWQSTFETSNTETVERYCKENDMNYRWQDSGLFLETILPATRCHPGTQEEVWFNQAEQWHLNSWARTKANTILQRLGADKLPKHSYYGDGTPIDSQHIHHLQTVYNVNQVIFQWQQGDLLIVDNLLCMHGRRSYTGQRSILVAMS